MKILWLFVFGALLFLPTETRADDPPYLKGQLKSYQDDQGLFWELVLMTEVSRIKLDGQDLEAVEFDDETKLWKFYKNSESTLRSDGVIHTTAVPRNLIIQNAFGITSASFLEEDIPPNSENDESRKIWMAKITRTTFETPEKDEKEEVVTRFVFMGRGNLNEPRRQQNSPTDNSNHLKRRSDAFKELEREIELLKTDPQ